jgi:heptosyltransferase II
VSEAVRGSNAECHAEGPGPEDAAGTPQQGAGRINRHYGLDILTPPGRPLLVRLRNWVGDVTLGVPALRRMAAAGYELQLLGKGFAKELLAGEGWPVHALPPTARERVALLRTLRAQAAQADGALGTRLNAVCLPYSFSSALELRWAGWRTLGHAQEGRSLLLAQALARPTGLHAIEEYGQVADALLGSAPAVPPPERINLAVAPTHQAQALALMREHGLAPGFIMICPFAGGTFETLDKRWPDFPAFVQTAGATAGTAGTATTAAARAVNRRWVICPGPGEEDEARRHYTGALCLPGVRLGALAALLQHAALMVSNDTGPGHIAAAVGTPVLSVLGPTNPDQWRAWGPQVRLLGGRGHWPSVGEALAATQALLAGSS